MSRKAWGSALYSLVLGPLGGATSGASSWREPLGFAIFDPVQIVGNRLEIREVAGIGRPD